MQDTQEIVLTTEGGSMRPLIKGGQTVRVLPTPFICVRLGDCVVYQFDDRLLLHRIWWRGKDNCWIKDDVGLMRFHSVPSSKILYKVTSNGPLARGLLGLSYSILNNICFCSLRSARRILFSVRKITPPPPLTTIKTPL